MKTFAEALRTRDLALTAQLRLDPESDREDVFRQASSLAPVVDAITVTDCPYGVLHLSGLAAAAMLLEQGVDPVVQLSTRDRNRIALQSELLGAAALGVTSLILHRGDKLPEDRPEGIHEVFDTGAKKFLAAGRTLSEHLVAQGRPELVLGTMAKVFVPKPGWEPSELTAKVQAGARFVQTQSCLNLEALRRYMEFLVADQLTWQASVIVSVPVLTSAQAARWLFENSRGFAIPESLVQGFETASDPVAHGIELSVGILRALRSIPGVSGACLSTPGEVEAVVEVARAIREEEAAIPPRV